MFRANRRRRFASGSAAGCRPRSNGKAPSAARDDRGYPLPWGTDEPTRERCQIFYGELGPGAGRKTYRRRVAAGAHERDRQRGRVVPGQRATRGSFILRGCSFATANIDDVRVTWRRKGDPRGEEDTGFRVVIPIAMPADAAGPVSSVEPNSDLEVSDTPTLLTPVVVLFSLPWDSISRDLGLAE